MTNTRPVPGKTLLAAASLIALHAFPAAAQTTAPTVPAGYTLSVFAKSAKITAPDSVIVAGGHVWVGYGNNAAPDGSKGSSNIVEYSLDGSVAMNLTFKGHNDGLRIDPYSHNLWVLQNEDAIPELIVVDPASGHVKRQMALRPVNGGGYDDAAFTGHRVFVSASNPALDANGINRHPAIVSLARTESGGLVPETVLSGDTLAINAVTHEAVRLNLTDPDSMTVMPNGDLLMTDQGDAQLIEVELHVGTGPFIKQIPLVGGVQVDDTVFATAKSGTLYISETPANTVYALTSKQFVVGQPYTASTGVPATATTPAVPAFVGKVALNTGATTPLVSGLSGPHGMAFQGD